MFLFILCSPASRHVQMLTKRLSTLRTEKSSLFTELTVEPVKPWAELSEG